MPYAIMRFKKTGSGGIAPAQKHNEREKTKYKSNPDIDAARIKNDYHIIKPDKPYRAVIKDRLAETGCRTRKDRSIQAKLRVKRKEAFSYLYLPNWFYVIMTAAEMKMFQAFEENFIGS